MTTRKPTMKDVAARAGVCVMTVSYALRGHSSISKKTTERVRQIAAEMGYTPHPFVSALIKEIRAGRKMKAPPVIAYVSSYAERSYWITNPVQGLYYRGAKARCEELGFAFELYELSKFNMSGERLSEAMRYANVCGLVLGPVPVPGMTLDLDWDAFSCVAFGHSMSDPPIHRVTLNHWHAIGLTLGKLTGMGYQRIAAGTTKPVSRRIGDLYLAGFDLFQRNLPPSQRIPILMERPRNPETMRKWLRQYRPDVFIDMASGHYLRSITEAGWRVPEDVAYTTMCWYPERSEVAAINENSFEIGKAAINVIVQQIHDNRRGIPKHPSFTMVNGFWVDGPSAPGKREGTRRKTARAT